MKHILFAALFALWVTNALAHSPLKSTSPSEGIVLSHAPEQITISFERDIRLTKVSSIHTNKQTDQLDLGDQTSFAKEFTVPLEGRGTGVYEIHWRGLGDDGHPQHGTFTFTVK